MTSILTGITRTLGPSHRRQRPERDDSGLTTLEWLLIVAAVAGIAALAVVLVQNVVSDTSEQISGSSARKTAAEVAAASVEQEAKNADPTDERYNTWPKWENYFTNKCDRIQITFADAGIGAMTSNFNDPTGSVTLTTVPLQTATKTGSATVAQVECEVS